MSKQMHRATSEHETRGSAHVWLPEHLTGSHTHHTHHQHSHLDLHKELVGAFGHEEKGITLCGKHSGRGLCTFVDGGGGGGLHASA